MDPALLKGKGGSKQNSTAGTPQDNSSKGPKGRNLGEKGSMLGLHREVVNPKFTLHGGIYQVRTYENKVITVDCNQKGKGGGVMAAAKSKAQPSAKSANSGPTGESPPKKITKAEFEPFANMSPQRKKEMEDYEVQQLSSYMHSAMETQIATAKDWNMTHQQIKERWQKVTEMRNLGIGIYSQPLCTDEAKEERRAMTPESVPKDSAAPNQTGPWYKDKNLGRASWEHVFGTNVQKIPHGTKLGEPTPLSQEGWLQNEVFKARSSSAPTIPAVYSASGQPQLPPPLPVKGAGSPGNKEGVSPMSHLGKPLVSPVKPTLPPLPIPAGAVTRASRGAGPKYNEQAQIEEEIQKEQILWPLGKPPNPKEFEAMWFDGLYYPAKIVDVRVNSPRYAVAWLGEPGVIYIQDALNPGKQHEVDLPYGKEAWVTHYRPRTQGEAVMCRRGAPPPEVKKEEKDDDDKPPPSVEAASTTLKTLDFTETNLQKVVAGEQEGAWVPMPLPRKSRKKGAAQKPSTTATVTTAEMSSSNNGGETKTKTKESPVEMKKEKEEESSGDEEMEETYQMISDEEEKEEMKEEQSDQEERPVIHYCRTGWCRTAACPDGETVLTPDELCSPCWDQIPSVGRRMDQDPDSALDAALDRMHNPSATTQQHSIPAAAGTTAAAWLGKEISYGPYRNHHSWKGGKKPNFWRYVDDYTDYRTGKTYSCKEGRKGWKDSNYGGQGKSWKKGKGYHEKGKFGKGPGKGPGKNMNVVGMSDEARAHVAGFGQAGDPVQPMPAPPPPPPNGANAQTITFCCFYSRLGWCRYGRRCRFTHHHLTAQQQMQIQEGYSNFQCDRITSSGQCKHKDNGEHI